MFILHFCKTDGKLNVIYLTKEAPEDQLKTEFEKLQKDVSFENFKYAWLNIEAEPEWAATFSKADGYPKVVVYSHGKRKKYLVHQEENTALAICKQLPFCFFANTNFKSSEHTRKDQ